MIKSRLRHIANKLLMAHGVEIVHKRVETDPLRQLLLALQHYRIGLIVDVGANAGQYARELFQAGYAGEIHSIEPQPDAHAALVHAASFEPRWSVLEPLAAGDREGTVDVIVAGNSLSSSVLPMLDRHVQAAPKSAPVGRITVRQTTIDNLYFEKLSRDCPALLKIDTQGYETQVLAGASRSLENFTLVQLELSLQPLYDGQQLWLTLIETMARSGFEVWSIHPEFCDPTTGQVLQVNSLFSRR